MSRGGVGLGSHLMDSGSWTGGGRGVSLQCRARWKECWVGGKPKSIHSSSHGKTGDRLAIGVTERETASACFCPCLGERMENGVVGNVMVWGENSTSGRGCIEGSPLEDGCSEVQLISYFTAF